MEGHGRWYSFESPELITYVTGRRGRFLGTEEAQKKILKRFYIIKFRNIWRLSFAVKSPRNLTAYIELMEMVIMMMDLGH